MQAHVPSLLRRSQGVHIGSEPGALAGCKASRPGARTAAPQGPGRGQEAARTGCEPGAPADLGQPVGEQPAADAADDAADGQDGGERGRVDVGRQLVHARVERRLEADERPAAHVVEGGGQRDRLRAAASPRVLRGLSPVKQPWKLSKLVSAQPPTSLKAAASVIACARRQPAASKGLSAAERAASAGPGLESAAPCQAGGHAGRTLTRPGGAQMSAPSKARCKADVSVCAAPPSGLQGAPSAHARHSRCHRTAAHPRTLLIAFDAILAKDRDRAPTLCGHPVSLHQT